MTDAAPSRRDQREARAFGPQAALLVLVVAFVRRANAAASACETAGMSFFELPPPPERRGERREPSAPRPWWAAPSNELGAPVPLRLVLARNERVALAVVGATAYTSGVEFRLVVQRRSRPSHTLDEDEFDDLEGDPFEHPFGSPRRRFSHRRELPPEILRFGVQFSDGRKATTVAEAWRSAPPAKGEQSDPAGPVLMQRGGSGGGGRWEQEFWLWPLPPPGPLAFVADWPSEGIALTRAEVDARLFLEASVKSELLWPAEAGAYGSGGTGVSMQVVLQSEGYAEADDVADEDGVDPKP